MRSRQMENNRGWRDAERDGNKCKAGNRHDGAGNNCNKLMEKCCFAEFHDVLLRRVVGRGGDSVGSNVFNSSAWNESVCHGCILRNLV